MRTITFIVFCTLLLFVNVQKGRGQTPYDEFRQQMDYVFEQVDKSKITTGLLSDYALELVELKNFNGVLTDSNYVDINTWADLYTSIYDAKINSRAQIDSSTEVIRNVTLSSTYAQGNMFVPYTFFMMHFEYERLDEKAYEKGNIDIVNDQLREVTGKPSPYQKDELFAVAPIKTTLAQGVNYFVFDWNLFYTNINKNVKSIEVSVNSTNAFTKVEWDRSFILNFTKAGEAIVYVRLTYDDNTYYMSGTRCMVEGDYPSKAPDNGGDNIDETISISKTTEHSGGKIEIKYSNKNSSKQIKKPLILVKPLAVNTIMKDKPNFSLSYLLEQGGIENIMNILNNFSDYDIVYINYDDALDDIFRNAVFFQQAVKLINQRKDKTLNHPNTMIGISIGGVIARYGLRSMEIKGEDHDTWKLITLDSPHKGFNFPVGMQGFIHHMGTFDLTILGKTIIDKGREDSDLYSLRQILLSPAMKQLLIYYCDENVKLNNSYHENFQKEYDKVGFPEKCQNVAVANGSDKGTAFFSNGSRILYHEEVYKDITEYGLASLLAAFSNAKILMLNAIWGKGLIKGKFTINGTPQKQSSVLYDGRIYLKKKILWIIPISANITHKELKATSTMVAVDGAAGSSLSMMDEIVKAIEVDMPNSFQKREFCFVPTSSALAMDNWDSYLNTNLSSRDIFTEGVSDMEEFWSDETNKDHGDLAAAGNYLASHLISPMILIGPSNYLFYSYNTLNLKNPQNASVSWSATSGIYIVDSSLTNVRVTSYEAGAEGVVTGTIKCPITLEGKDKIYYKKRMKCTSPPSLAGGFDNNGLGKFYLIAQGESTPIKWSLSNTTDFKIIKSTMDTIIIQALGYKDKLTLTGTLIAGKEYKFTKELTSPELKIMGSNVSYNGTTVFDKKEYELEISPREGYEYIKWTIPSYLEVTGPINTPKVTVKGVTNGEYLTVRAETKVKGKVYSTYISSAVRIPVSMTIKVQERWKENGNYKTLLVAEPKPFNTNGTYRWSSTGCFVTPCRPDLNVNPGDLGSGSINPGITNPPVSGGGGSINPFSNAPTFNNTIDPSTLTEELYEQLTRNTNKENVCLKLVGIMENENQEDIWTIEVSENNEQNETTVSDSQYITLVPASNSTTIDFPERLPAIPLNDPRCAVVLQILGRAGTVTCTFTTPGGMLTATFEIPAISTFYTSSYNTSEKSIYLTREKIQEENYEEEIYKATVYNDFGIVKEVSFYSSEEKVYIPMQGYGQGNYYINVKDNKGNVVTNQAIPIK